MGGMYAIRKLYCVKSGFSLWVMLGLYLLSMARAFFPAELNQAIVLGDKYLYAWLYIPLRDFLAADLMDIEGFQLSIGQGLLVLWMVIACILLARHLFRYHKACMQIRKYASMCSAQAYTVLETVQDKLTKPQRVSLYTMPNIEVPFGVGLFQKAILLPENHYTDEELYYILLHEYTHFQNHDIPIKFMVSIFCCIFWWNPIVYLLKADLEQMLEIKCDTTVVQYMRKPEKAAYLRTIVSAMRNISVSRPVCYTATTFVHFDDTQNIKERFQAVTTNMPRNFQKQHLWVTLACMIMVVSSYILLPQPAYEAPKSIGPNVIDFDASNAYIKQSANGTCWLCISGMNPKRISLEQAFFYEQIGFSIREEFII